MEVHFRRSEGVLILRLCQVVRQSLPLRWSKWWSNRISSLSEYRHSKCPRAPVEPEAEDRHRTSMFVTLGVVLSGSGQGQRRSDNADSGSAVHGRAAAGSSSACWNCCAPTLQGRWSTSSCIHIRGHPPALDVSASSRRGESAPRSGRLQPGARGPWWLPTPEQ
jgi:hypothetical protein